MRARGRPRLRLEYTAGAPLQARTPTPPALPSEDAGRTRDETKCGPPAWPCKANCLRPTTSTSRKEVAGGCAAGRWPAAQRVSGSPPSPPPQARSGASPAEVDTLALSHLRRRRSGVECEEEAARREHVEKKKGRDGTHTASAQTVRGEPEKTALGFTSTGRRSSGHQSLSHSGIAATTQ